MWCRMQTDHPISCIPSVYATRTRKNLWHMWFSSCDFPFVSESHQVERSRSTIVAGILYTHHNVAPTRGDVLRVAKMEHYQRDTTDEMRCCKRLYLVSVFTLPCCIAHTHHKTCCAALHASSVPACLATFLGRWWRCVHISKDDRPAVRQIWEFTRSAHKQHETQIRLNINSEALFLSFNISMMSTCDNVALFPVQEQHVNHDAGGYVKIADTIQPTCLQKLLSYVVVSSVCHTLLVSSDFTVCAAVTIR